MLIGRTDYRRGAALITAVGVLAILLAVVVTLMTLTSLELRTAGNAAHSARARFVAEGGVSIGTAILRACDPTFASLNQAWRTYFNGNDDWFDNDGDGYIDYWTSSDPGINYFARLAAEPGAVSAHRDKANPLDRPALWSELNRDSGVDLDGDGVLDSAWFLVTVPILDDNGNLRNVDEFGIYTYENGRDDDYDCAVDETDEVMERVIGRFAVLITDEASKLNINAAGNLAGQDILGNRIHSADEGVAPYELDLRALPNIADGRARNIVGYRYGTLRKTNWDENDGFNQRVPGWARADRINITYGDDDANDFHISQDGVNNDADWYEWDIEEYLDIDEEVHPGLRDVETGIRPLRDEYLQDYLRTEQMTAGSRDSLRTGERWDVYRDFVMPPIPANSDRWGQTLGFPDKSSESEEGIDDPSEYRPFHPYGDDQFFRSIEQVKEVGRPKGGFDDPSISVRTFDGLRNLITVSSYADRTVHLERELGGPEPTEYENEWLGAESRELKLNPNFAAADTMSDHMYKLYYDRFKEKGYDIYSLLIDPFDDPEVYSLKEALNETGPGGTLPAGLHLDQFLNPHVPGVGKLPLPPQFSANISDAADTDFSTTEVSVDVPYSDGVAEFKFRGVEQIRISEIMARPVYRVEAEDQAYSTGRRANLTDNTAYVEHGPEVRYASYTRNPEGQRGEEDEWLYNSWTRRIDIEGGIYGGESIPILGPPRPETIPARDLANLDGEVVYPRRDPDESIENVSIKDNDIPNSSPSRWYEVGGWDVNKEPKGYVDTEPPFGENDIEGEWTFTRLAAAPAPFNCQDDFVALPYCGSYYLMLDLAARDMWGNILPLDALHNDFKWVTPLGGVKYRVEGYTLLPGTDGRNHPVFIDTGWQDIDPNNYRNGYALVDMYKAEYGDTSRLGQGTVQFTSGTGLDIGYDAANTSRIEPFYMHPVDPDLTPSSLRIPYLPPVPGETRARAGAFLRVRLRKTDFIDVRTGTQARCFFNGVVLSGEPDLEWIELANVGDTPVDLSDWQIDVTDKDGTVHASATLPRRTIIGPMDRDTLEPGLMLFAVDDTDERSSASLRPDFPVDSIYGNTSSFMVVHDRIDNDGNAEFDEPFETMLQPATHQTCPQGSLSLATYPALTPRYDDPEELTSRQWDGVGDFIDNNDDGSVDKPYDRIARLEINYWDDPPEADEPDVDEPETMTSFNALHAGGFFPDPMMDGINNDFDDADGDGIIQTSPNNRGENPDADEPDELLSEVFVKLYRGPASRGKLVDEVAYTGATLRGYRPMDRHMLPEGVPPSPYPSVCPNHPEIIRVSESETCPIDGVQLEQAPPGPAVKVREYTPNRPRGTYGRAIERGSLFDPGDTPNLAMPNRLVDPPVRNNDGVILDGVFDQWDGSHDALIRDLYPSGGQGRRAATPLAVSVAAEIDYNFATVPDEVYAYLPRERNPQWFDTYVKNGNISTVGGVLDVPYYTSWVEVSGTVSGDVSVIKRSRASSDIFGETFGSEIDLGSNSSVMAEIMGLFDTSMTQLTVGQVWNRGFDQDNQFKVWLDNAKGPNNDQPGFMQGGSEGGLTPTEGQWEHVSENGEVKNPDVNSQFPVVAYASTGYSEFGSSESVRTAGTWLWDADDGVEDGVYRLYVQLAPPAWDPDMYRVDVSVYTDQSGPAGRPNGRIDTSYDLVMNVGGLQPGPDGMIEVGLVEVQGQQLAVRLTNQGDPSLPHYFYRVILAPRRHDWGRININTAWDAPADNLSKPRLPNGKHPTDFYNTLAAAPVFRQTFDGRRLGQAPTEKIGPAQYGPESDSQLRDFINRIQEARKFENADPKKATPFRQIGDLLRRNVRGDGRILTDITDISAAGDPELAFEQRREIVERFKRISNLFTTQSDVFEIICLAQSGFVLNEPKEDNSGGPPGRRVPGRYDFESHAERKIRVVYER